MKRRERHKLAAPPFQLRAIWVSRHEEGLPCIDEVPKQHFAIAQLIDIMTDSIEQILDDAERFLEDNRFSEARDHFRRAVVLAQPNSKTLTNWQVAEVEERLSFMRQVADAHVNDVDCRLVLANELIRHAKAAQAILICNDLLQLAIDPRKELLTHMMRFQAAAESNRWATFADDFVFVWRSEVNGAERFRKRLLRAAASLDDANAIPSLERIASDIGLPGNVKVFLEAKCVELHALEEITGSRDNGGVSP